MSPEKQRIAIATACGLQNVAPVVVRNVRHQGDDITVGISSDSGWIPNYLTDLNACHQMEKVLDIVVERGDYWDYLSSITGGEVEMIYATAAEKCEAFLRTLGLWEEEQ